MSKPRSHADRQLAHTPAPLETARWLLAELHEAIDALPEPDPVEIERLVRWTAARCDETLLNLMNRQLGTYKRRRDDEARSPIRDLIFAEQRRALSLRDSVIS